jgi:hypothetical protein
MQKNVEFHAGIHRGQSLVHSREWRGLRRQQTAETNRDRNESNDLDVIYPGWFDFTLGTA